MYFLPITCKEESRPPQQVPGRPAPSTHVRLGVTAFATVANRHSTVAPLSQCCMCINSEPRHNPPRRFILSPHFTGDDVEAQRG